MKEDTRTGRAGVTEEDKGEPARGGRKNIMMKNGARQAEREARDTKHIQQTLLCQ